MKTKTDRSYGVIPIRRINDTWEVFLIHQFSKIGKNSYWVFPKGHPEGKETPEQTAVRELEEETGMVAEKILPEPIFTLNYSFRFDGVKILKSVEFFVGIILQKDHKLQSDEVKEAGWYSLEAAAKRLDYQDTKNMFQEVNRFLETHKE